MTESSQGKPARSPFIEVFYGTNRARLDACDGQSSVTNVGTATCVPSAFYTGDSAKVDASRGRTDALEVGRLTVTIPPGHQTGKVERPSAIFTIDLRKEDSGKDVVLSEISTFGSDYDGWARALRGTGKQHAFVYVHGYYTDFASAARQVGQLAFDLELDRDFGGVPLLYSWPSQGTIKGYISDYDASLNAAESFNRFLDLVKLQAQISQVHVIAHSMGNWMVANALRERLPKDGTPATENLLNQLVLAAPDIPADGFRERFLRTLPQLARRVTLYLSDNDKALKASAKLRTGYARAGELKGGVMNDSAPRFDAIDASSLPADFLDHSYYADNRSMLADIYCLLRGSPASGRPLIESAGVNWRFRATRASLRADNCPGADLDKPEIKVPIPILTPVANPGFLRSYWRWIAACLVLIGVTRGLAGRLRRAR